MNPKPQDDPLQITSKPGDLSTSHETGFMKKPGCDLFAEFYL
jgi:hypothetical protein